MSKTYIVLIVFWVSILLSGHCNALAEETATGTTDAEPDAARKEVVATVNGEPITAAQHRMILGARLAQLQQGGVTVTEDMKRQIEKSALEMAINNKLMAEEARRRGVGISEERLDQEMNAILKALGSEAELDTRLALAGLTREEFREQIKEARDVSSLMATMKKEIQVGADQVEAYFESHKDQFLVPEQVHTSHILVRVGPDATDEEKQNALEKAELLSQRAKAGEDFAELARQSSDGPSAPRGGDLGLVTRDSLVPSFAEAAFKLGQGEISAPVLTRYGYHVIKVHERVPERPHALENVESQVRDTLQRKQLLERASSLIGTLREQSDIQIQDSGGGQR